LEVKNFIAL